MDAAVSDSIKKQTENGKNQNVKSTKINEQNDENNWRLIIQKLGQTSVKTKKNILASA